jgi:hypothetical protein
MRLALVSVIAFVLSPIASATIVQFRTPSGNIAGDTAVDKRAKVLRYGSKWSRGGFTCASRRTGLRCRNRSGHGWFLSRPHSYKF